MRRVRSENIKHKMGAELWGPFVAYDLEFGPEVSDAGHVAV